MFKHSFLVSEKADDLVSLLSDPGRAKKILEGMKSESAKLIRLRKELTKGKTLSAFCKQKEEELKAKGEGVEKAMAALAESKKSLEELSKATKRDHAEMAREIEKEGVRLGKERTQLAAIEDGLQESIRKVMEDKAIVKREREAAFALKEEYEEKLTDLKERMKGL